MNREIRLSQTIAALRKKHRVTQEQLAKAVNVTPQAVSKWENAHCYPDTVTLPLIADYFRVSIDELFYGDERRTDESRKKDPNRPRKGE